METIALDARLLRFKWRRNAYGISRQVFLIKAVKVGRFQDIKVQIGLKGTVIVSGFYFKLVSSVTILFNWAKSNHLPLFENNRSLKTADMP